ncbi:30S ribosomal protein S6 [Candidatus Falkowbacteria bacterium RIFOXYB2_FULL_34_18]|uniref:Small ribosomal subunit protein bS6 n=1 Tax=Candidatus Falkowbacteria bacterium RIFOXYD2_FULL_34_120 TaxID=1798007 RepID=A0A1F5TPB3_9BACT|nr:MAG: 30S ribosomal protein S6 [Candidatus Falkowbacteria bacterium RIFOXYB2_FULL_34_18]OGF29023.1 MAG: 30S ribosomal protein S6 [Candidatus Falkowbacteria bacterium RIFOXYC12_FULL_34_55]OGF35960.1 MAG: 30S ribosomal protein S6 [Candidatus Falkowbacteria bacterium RIFOXYC2_FULL_34_220]OGF38506.1 MAG: 30S ribosomal protein S6 [Candidatus Falkowbacteria bacterium RIFOXYD12_FULL_34_57]OGF40668.1 MAG: 30S ribosomal protein S6 [Candidatus Falkowbacteria bacterium RIFOXYD2_FULL_34_120]
MAKSKKSGISHYELLYIISNKFTEEELKPIMEKVNKFVTGNGGTITYSEEWGNKKMAYPINHFNFGYYNLLEFDAEGSKLQEIDKVLRLSHDVLRHQIVVKKMRTEEEIKKEKEEEKNRVKKEKEKTKEEIKKEEKPKEEERTTTKVKVDLNDLDAKLDKILDTNDLL